MKKIDNEGVSRHPPKTNEEIIKVISHPSWKLLDLQDILENHRSFGLQSCIDTVGDVFTRPYWGLEAY